MPAYAIQQPELQSFPQESRQLELPSRVCEELDACTETGRVERNKLKAFLLETGIRSITEMDYPLRQAYKEYLDQHIQKPERYLKAYDRVKQHSIREQMQTLAGRQQCRWQLEDRILFLLTIRIRPLWRSSTPSGTGQTWYGTLSEPVARP